MSLHGSTRFVWRRGRCPFHDGPCTLVRCRAKDGYLHHRTGFFVRTVSAVWAPRFFLSCFFALCQLRDFPTSECAFSFLTAGSALPVPVGDAVLFSVTQVERAPLFRHHTRQRHRGEDSGKPKNQTQKQHGSGVNRRGLVRCWFWDVLIRNRSEKLVVS